MGRGVKGATTGAYDSFVRPCRICGTTIHTISGQEQPHDCLAPSGPDALAYAWWQGHDTATTTRPARPARRPRSVKVEDDLWEAAKRKADERGEILSEVIREALKRYVRKP